MKAKTSVQRRNRDRSKDVERRVARMLDGDRRGVLGGADVENSQYAIEVKSRKKIVIDKWWEQAVRNAKKRKKEPLLVCHVFNTSRYYVVMDIEQFKRIIGKEG